MPLAIGIVEMAVANHTARCSPLEKRCMAIFERLDTIHQAIPTMFPACVGGAAAPLEPGIPEHTVAYLTELRLRTIDGKTPAFDHLHILRPAIPGDIEQHR